MLDKQNIAKTVLGNRLIADIGGTNARFALLDSVKDEILVVEKLRCADYETIVDAANAFLDNCKAQSYPTEGCIAVACPVIGDEVNMTNHVWSFSIQAVKVALDLDMLEVVNDYTALAYSIPCLKDSDKVQIGEGKAVEGKPIAIIGPGTGLGIGGLVFSETKPIVIQTEGGHANFAPIDMIEVDLLSILLKRFNRVSIERLLSGPGLVNLYQAVCELRGKATHDYLAADITQHAVEKTCEVCLETLEHFCAMLGSAAGNLALTMGSHGGVYITGGIVPRFIEFIQNSKFRQRFEEKGRLSHFVKDIPTYVVIADEPGLIGAAAVLDHAEIARIKGEANG